MPFVPDLTVAFRTAPAARPSSALKSAVCTLNSGNRIQRGKNDKVCSVQEVDGVGIVVNAIEQVVVLRGLEAIGGKGAGGRIASGVRLGRIRARAQLCQKRKVTPIERQIINGLTGDRLPTDDSEVCSSGGAVVTWTVSEVAPVLSCTLTCKARPTVTCKFCWVVVEKPGAVTVME